MNSINFPNLGIHLENVPSGFDVFGFHIAFYGVIIGLAILAGFLIAFRLAAESGQKQETYMDMGLIGVVLGIIGARAYYVIFSWEYYRQNPMSIFNIREGGLAIFGGIIMAFLTVLVYSKVKKLNTLQIADVIAICIVNGQMLGRWGNFFNREAFGGYTNNLLAMQLPRDRVRLSDITPVMSAHIQTIEGVDFIQVHPTFLYESLLCLAILLFLVLYRKHKKFHGELFLIYLAAYGLGRFFIEGLRTDQLILGWIGLPVSQLLAGTIFVVASICLVVTYIKKRTVARVGLGAFTSESVSDNSSEKTS